MPAYAIFIRNAITDPEEMKIYAAKAAKARDGHNLKPLIRYGALETLEGPPSEGVVLLEFPTMAEAKAWYDSPAYQDALQHRLKGSDYRVILAEGV